MRRRAGFVTAAALAFASCGGEEADVATADGNGVGNATPPAAAPRTAATGQQYVSLVGAIDQFEYHAARLALQQARRTEVREFARMLLADHQRSGAALARAAARMRPPLRRDWSPSSEQQADWRALQRAHGAVFDSVWLRQKVNAHERALTLVTAYATSGESEPLRRHAAGVAEPIRRHLARARQLEVPAPRAR